MATLSWWMEWSVENVREAFFSYFGENQHVRLPSTPVIPVDDPKVPLLHTCLHRFKGTLGGRERHRTCFSLRCIIASGDEDLIDRFRIDATFHRFTEILGSWSHGYYFKEEAIGSLFSLLTEVDFWMAGETGPCGPCIGFFLDCSDNDDGVDFVRNITDGKLVEICRLVFVEKEIHYDLDVYAYVIRQVYWRTGKGFNDYTGKVGAADTDGVDTAYRLVADHMRMIAVTNAPGSQLGLGNEGREYFLKCADKQAVKYGYQVLKINEEDYDIVVDAILLNEPDLCTELEREIIDRIVKDEVMIYKKTKAEGYRISWSAHTHYPQGKGYTVLPSSNMQRSPAWRENNPRFRYQESVGEPSHPSCPEAPFVWQYTNAGMQLYICKCFENECPLTQKLSYCPLILQLEQNLELSEFNKQVLGVLPKLTCSLYFDVTFSSSCGLEKTFETALFGFLGVPLRHGWLVDPQDAELDSSIRRSSYSKLSYNLAIYESIRPKANSGPQKHGRYEDDMFYSALAFSKTGSEKELDSTSCKSRQHKFSSLHNDLRALQPTVLIWNEKLITISKFEDKIYVLLNDLSLLRTETDAVWERLTQANSKQGDTNTLVLHIRRCRANGGVFVDCNFVPTDSKIQSVLPLKKTERKKRIKEKMDLKKKEKDSNKDKDDEDTKDRDDEETEEKDDGNTAPQTYFLQGRHINLNVRPINFLGLSTHVIHQINDGPCALIAVCNVLLLSGDISFEPHETVVSMEYLLGLVLALLGGSVKMQDYSDERKSQILDVVKSLAGGFDMDVIFTSLVSLQEDFVENVPCILFWNKHYHTIVMINGVLNSLVTDSNYLETRVVWQTLDRGSYFVPETSTSGASTSFMKANSKGITPHGDGLYSDCSLTQLCSGPDASLLRDGYGSHFVPTEEDTSHEKSVSGPQFVHETS
ncbi:Alanine--tRNA ligase [Zea mays]|uniref:alanine--tRNA ligase n=1 Tax=Zea mays TaxID=4577 RepID=A0A317Y9T1_MAIZE|nr:Alanine--tRNA ligase [Zea mays]